jgi:predicted MFS family arabinose efflux permease
MPLPFVLAGGIVLAATLVQRPVVRLQSEAVHTETPEAVALRILVKDPGLRLFAAVNLLLALSFAALRTFIVLYVTEGLGRSPQVASLVIGVVAVAYVFGAPLASRLERRFDVVSVMTVFALIYGVGLCAGALPTSLGPELVLLPFVALAGSVLLTLPQALAFLLAPEGSEGSPRGSSTSHEAPEWSSVHCSSASGSGTRDRCSARPTATPRCGR